MSVVLYRKGDQQDINGLLCDVMLVAPELFDVEHIPEGWFLTPRRAYEENKEETKIVEETKAEPETEEKPEEVKVLKGNAKIRDDAKKAGIKDWETARITTLEKKLKA